MNKALFAAADFLARPPGAWWTLGALAVGSAYAWFGGVNVVTYWLSVAALAWSALILMNGERSDAAVHVKLDWIIAVLGKAPNRVVGLEHEEPAVIEAEREQVERAAREA